METIQINVYSIKELSPEAQRRAIDKYNDVNDFDYIWYEAKKTVEAFCEQTGIKTGRNSWLEFNINNIEDTVLELTGIRLMKYFINNYTFLFRPKFLKDFNGHKKHRMVQNKIGYKGKEYCFAYSNIQKTIDCNLTGMDYDDAFLTPIYDFIKKPNNTETFQDIISECFSNLRQSIESEIEAIQEDNFVIEEMELNDLKFTEDGEIFRY